MYHMTLSSSNMLNYGCTRLEIGVQSVYEDVARDTNRWNIQSYSAGMYIISVCVHCRGHTVNAVCESFQGAKDAGFKVSNLTMPLCSNVPTCN